MQETYHSIFVGVASGLIASTAIFIIVQTFNKAFVPWYQQKTYHGINISGKWYWLAEYIQKAQLELTQTASSIKGVYTIINLEDINGIESIRTYKVEGEIIDRFLYLNLRNNDKSKLGAMVFLLEVVGDGSELKGCCSSYSIDSHKIGSIQESFFKTEEQSLAYSRITYALPKKEANKKINKDT